MHVFWLIYRREVEIFGHVATANDVINLFIKRKDRSATYIDMHEIHVKTL